MRAAALLLMASGWAIFLAAIALLAGQTLQLEFTLAGIAVEIVGLSLLLHFYRSDLQSGEDA